MRLRVVSLLVTLTCAAGGRAQERASVTRAADLSRTSAGRQHHLIQTKSKEAQEYFDQGLTLVYGFNHEEAARAFQKAAELDPASPMPLWGIALAVGPNYNQDVDPEREKQAFQAIEKAKTLAGNGPQSEKDYVAAMATRYTDDAKPDYKQLARDYAAAMKALSAKYPDDPDAATMYAESLMDLDPWRLWSLDGKPGPNTLEIVSVLEGVLARDPDHAGANHYYIHAIEASPHPEKALMSARRLTTLVPQAGHLVHMPAHIYERTGDYELAATTNAQAAKVDTDYAERAAEEGSLYDLMYHSHNEHFEAMAASMEGRYAEAKGAADHMVARLTPHAAMMPMLDAFLMTPIWVDARFGKWKEIFGRPEPPKEWHATHAMWRYARACAYAETGKMAGAEKERDLFAAEYSALPPEAMLSEFNTQKDVLGIALEVIEARMAAAKGNRAVAIEHWRQAVGMQDRLKYDEPVDWYYPVRESLGAALLANGNAADAERVFREDLQRNPRNPRSLLGLREALTAQGKNADAEWVDDEFRKGWERADVGLEITEL